MDKAKVEELRSADQATLEKELLALSEEQFKLRMQKGTGQLASPARVKAVRRDIARVKTFLRAKADEAKG